jgi:hypothetical protein
MSDVCGSHVHVELNVNTYPEHTPTSRFATWMLQIFARYCKAREKAASLGLPLRIIADDKVA